MKKHFYYFMSLLMVTGFQSSFAQNYFAGPAAGASNTTGADNTFVGNQAGTSNTSGGQNSFFGNFSGRDNITGSGNSFYGAESGLQGTTGSFNTFMGYQTGFGNNGTGNTFMGFLTGAFSYTGNNNAFFGNAVGYYNYGNNNSFFGANAGANNLGGVNNTYVGSEAGINAKSSNGNAFLGYRSGYKNTSGSYNTFLGRESGYNLTSSVNNVFAGYQSGYSTTTGSHNIFFGVQGGYLNTTGQYNIALGNYAGPASGALTYATAIGGRARVNISNAIVLGAINGVNGATADTRVGIRTASPGYTFHVNASDAAKVGGGTWVVASDKRLKDNVSDFTDGIELLSLVHPVTFKYNGKAGIKNDKQFVGVIAQEMQQIAPYTVGQFDYTDESGKKETYLDFDANALTYLLINSVKQQQRRIDSLESEILEIKRMIRSGNTTGDALQPKLFQNQPNPANNSTVIRYFIPDEAKTAYLGIFSMKGELVKTVNITGRGNGSYVMSIKEFASGAYTYQLVVDRITVGAKKLIVGK